MKKYYPILLSKTGELIALHYLAQKVKQDICPVIEMLENTIYKAVKVKKEPTGEYKYDDFFEKTLTEHWSFSKNDIILDVSLFDVTSSNIALIKRIFNNLLKAGVNVIPAVQKNSERIYLDLVEELIRKYECKICIRTSNSSGGYLNMNKPVTEMLKRLNISTNNTILLVDIGQVTKEDYNDKAAIAGFAIEKLTTPVNEWSAVVVSSGSFPKDLTDFAVSDKPHKLRRYEKDVFQELITSPALTKIKYGDYGTKNAIYEEANFAGSISVKYTTDDNYVIYRGKLSGDHIHGHGQYITHAKSLVRSTDYSGSAFSWGDSKIDEISRQDVNAEKKNPGSPQTWVEYSQNHHVTLLHSIL